MSHIHTLQCSNTLTEKGMEHELRISQCIKPHLNLRLMRGLLGLTSSSKTGPLPPSKYYLLWDDNTVNFSSTILQLRTEYSPDDYAELVLICLVQFFAALQHLYTNGICHRDVGLESIYVTRVDEHWLIKLGNFRFALHHPGPVSATSFVYGYHELEWLGGANCSLPPEVIDTPENAQTIDYSHTDSFASGCLIYEMLGLRNPFEKNVELVYHQYAEANLPQINCGSKYDEHFHHLAALLVKRDPSKRLSASTALLICETLLWLPHFWLKETISENHIRYHLELEHAALLSEIAERNKDHIPLPLLLKAKFLLNCNISKLSQALSLFKK